MMNVESFWDKSPTLKLMGIIIKDNNIWMEQNTCKIEELN